MIESSPARASTCSAATIRQFLDAKDDLWDTGSNDSNQDHI